MRNSIKKSDDSSWFGTLISGAALLVGGVLYQSAITETITVDGGESLPGA
ncbi:MAG: hypothetical protein JW829_17260 [Pirellulales bacterium]|nr:hypothetical protein [Pirellulales bacterium]